MLSPFQDHAVEESVQHLALYFPSIQSHKKKVRLNLTTKKTPEWCIIDSEEPPRNQLTLPKESLPTMAEHPQPEPTAIHLHPTPKLPTLYAVLIEPPKNFIIQKALLATP